MTRRSFSSEFKLESVRLAEASGNTARTARELGVRPDMIRRWKKGISEVGRRALLIHVFNAEYPRLLINTGPLVPSG